MPEISYLLLRKKKKKKKWVDVSSTLPTITPNAKCLLRMRKFEGLKDYLLMEKNIFKIKS